jgi:hypothetical protein
MKIVLTLHVRLRLLDRTVLEEELVEALRWPDKIKKRHRLYYFQKRLERGTI